ncbi:gibberellin-regulated protein 14-like [Homarus americanus]|uniref:gibberellin-regulated protein 14-like n=1 Tax=Homarus americanus TaxID=6706 RepID=UPI001C4735AA|nr:gibberellin-regulated protein 14-like [Homarus americanus]
MPYQPLQRPTSPSKIFWPLKALHQPQGPYQPLKGPGLKGPTQPPPRPCSLKEPYQPLKDPASPSKRDPASLWKCPTNLKAYQPLQRPYQPQENTLPASKRPISPRTLPAPQKAYNPSKPCQPSKDPANPSKTYQPLQRPYSAPQRPTSPPKTLPAPPKIYQPLQEPISPPKDPTSPSKTLPAPQRSYQPLKDPTSPSKTLPTPASCSRSSYRYTSNSFPQFRYNTVGRGAEYCGIEPDQKHGTKVNSAPLPKLEKFNPLAVMLLDHEHCFSRYEEGQVEVGLISMKAR